MSATIYSFQTGKVIQPPETQPTDWGAHFAQMRALVDSKSATPSECGQSPLERVRAYVRELRDLYFEEDDV